MPKKKGYKNETQFYKIPVVGEDDVLSEEIEVRKWNIVENQLMAANMGLSCCVFEEGEYRLIDNVNGTYSVMIVGTGQHPSLVGILNGGYVHSKKPIVWQGLKKNVEYHLYITYTQNLYEKGDSFSTAMKRMRVDSTSTSLYLARVDCRQTPPVVDLKPDGKIYSHNIAVHANDDTNAHGVKMYQDELVILKRLTFDHNTKGAVVLYNEEGTGELNSTFKAKKIIKKTMSGGLDGVELPMEASKVHLVQVEESVSGKPTFSLGNIAVQYPKEKDQPITIYNDGSEGVPIRVFVLYE